MNELKPCPFCGNANVAQGSSGGMISVWCFCGAQGPSVDFPETCIDPIRPIAECHEAWNKRTSDAAEIDRLHAIEAACKRLAYIVRKSVNSGPLSRDPTQEAEAWRQLRVALGEGYDERGNLVPIGEAK